MNINESFWKYENLRNRFKSMSIYENHVVWGATAMILNEFLSLFDQ